MTQEIDFDCELVRNRDSFDSLPSKVRTTVYSGQDLSVNSTSPPVHPHICVNKTLDILENIKLTVSRS